MSPDTTRVQAQLGQRRRALARLDAVEEAEYVVRSHHRELLTRELVELRKELEQAERHLVRAKCSNDLTFVVVAEERLGGVKRQASILQRHSDHQELRFQRARGAYLAERTRLLDHIAVLQRTLERLRQRHTDL
jgi:hypothetical protein